MFTCEYETIVDQISGLFWVTNHKLQPSEWYRHDELVINAIIFYYSSWHIIALSTTKYSINFFHFLLFFPIMIHLFISKYHVCHTHLGNDMNPTSSPQDPQGVFSRPGSNQNLHWKLIMSYTETFKIILITRCTGSQQLAICFPVRKRNAWVEK